MYVCVCVCVYVCMYVKITWRPCVKEKNKGDTGSYKF